ncbi:MAG: hypothetical protein PHS41_12930 [Victivallaceae bacterium]|nr:hypothetical protein [Victivallaceae bacterium]
MAKFLSIKNHPDKTKLFNKQKDDTDKSPVDGFRVDQERNEMADLSVATRRVTTEKPPLQAFFEPPEDTASILAVPSHNDTDKSPVDGFRVDQERNEMADLSVATRRVTTEKPPLQAFFEPPEDTASILAVPS